MIDANDGIIATASLLQGFAGAGASDRLLLLAATAATIAGGLSAGGAKWAEVAVEREAEQRLVREESAELEADLRGEIDELTAHWQAKGLSPKTARTVIVSLTVTSIIAARAGHLVLRKVLVRSLVVGIGTMAVSYVAGLVLF